MSYDVGYEKPDGRIFLAAEQMLVVLSKARGDAPWNMDLESWDKIYVGDEYQKDVIGARNAGWFCVLVGDERGSVQQLSWNPNEGDDLLQALREHNGAVGFDTLARVEHWLWRAL